MPVDVVQNGLEGCTRVRGRLGQLQQQRQECAEQLPQQRKLVQIIGQKPHGFQQMKGQRPRFDGQIMQLRAEQYWRFHMEPQHVQGTVGIVVHGILNKWLKPLPITPKILIMLVIVIVVAVLMRNTRFGRNIYMIGGNAETAWLAGIKSSRYTILIFAFSGACCALGGALFAIAQSSALPNMGEKGISPLLVALAATIIGGTDTNGGRGSVWNTFVAVLGLMVMSFVLSNIFGKFEVQILANGLILAICVFYETITAYYNNKKSGIRQPLLEQRQKELESAQ